MRTIALSLILAAWAAAEQPKQTAKQLTTEERLALENISLREALIQAQYRDLQAAKQNAITAACKRAGADAAKCQIDPQTGAITEQDATPKK